MPKTQNLDIVIAGVLDPSLISAINKTEAQLKALGASVRTSNMAMKGVYAAAFAPPEEMTKAMRRVNAFHEKIRDIGTVATGIGLGNILSEGVEIGIAKVKEFIGALGEASNLAANLEQQKFEIKTDLAFSDAQMTKLSAYFWQRSISTPFMTPQSMEAYRVLSSSIPEANPLLKDPMVRKRLEEVQDIAAVTAPSGASAAVLNEHMAELAKLFATAEKRGALLEKVIQPLEQAGIMLRPWLEQRMGMLPAGVNQGNIAEKLTPEQRSEIDAQLDKIIHARHARSMLIDEWMDQFTAPGGKGFQGAAKAAQTTFGVESSFGDVIKFLQTEIGAIENGPLKQLLSTINAGFAKEIPILTEYFDHAGAAFNAGFKPILETLAKADWDKVGKDIMAVLDALGKMFEKAKPIFQWMAKDLPEEIDTLARITTAIEKVATVIEKAFGWALNFGGKVGAATNVTAGDRLAKAQEAVRIAGESGSDQQLIAAKAELSAAEKAQTTSATGATKSLDGLNKMVDKVSGNDLVHLNSAIDEATKKLLDFSGAFPGGSLGGNAFLHGGLSDNPNETYYEHPDTEGHSSQYGPEGNRLGYGYGVGLGEDIARQYNAPQGSWVKVRTPNGRVLWRQVNERSSRKHGIEFVTPSTDESSYGSGKSEILETSKTKPEGVSYSPTYHIQVWDGSGLDRILSDHGEKIRSHLASLSGLDNERYAPI